MRLTAEMISRSPAFLNAMKDRELDLRGAREATYASSMNAQIALPGSIAIAIR